MVFAGRVGVMVACVRRLGEDGSDVCVSLEAG